jgi:hypothetical protein
MARMRFTKTERATFTVGTVIEWRNGTHWHPGLVVDPIDTSEDWHRIGIRHTCRRTATISPGQYVRTRPTCVRLPVAS